MKKNLENILRPYNTLQFIQNDINLANKVQKDDLFLQNNVKFFIK